VDLQKILEFDPLDRGDGLNRKSHGFDIAKYCVGGC
jgi:hypothetical protein